MLDRRSLRLPIILGVTMIMLIVVIIVGWVLLTSFNALREHSNAPMYWTLLSVGTVILTVVLVGVVLYLTLSIKAINLNRRQSNFVDSVTHELKSPIASLKLYLQTFNRRPVSQEERETFYKYMLDDVERLDTLISHLLSAGHVEKPNTQREIEPFSLDSLTREIVDAVALRYGLDQKNFKLDIQACEIEAAKFDVDLILRNIIDNAVKYSGKPPLVRVQLSSADDEYVRVRVVDNGRGIPRSMRRKIFGRFVRLGSELTREKPGTGLGLYIVRTLVKRCSGKVSVTENDQGTGTAFEVTLPKRPLKTKNANRDQ